MIKPEELILEADNDTILVFMGYDSIVLYVEVPMREGRHEYYELWGRSIGAIEGGLLREYKSISVDKGQITVKYTNRGQLHLMLWLAWFVIFTYIALLRLKFKAPKS